MEIRLEKIKELLNAVHPDNKEIGYSKEGEMFSEPKVGEQFVLVGRNVGWEGFATSRVTEIIDQDTFKTMNSVYKITRLK